MSAPSAAVSVAIDEDGVFCVSAVLPLLQPTSDTHINIIVINTSRRPDLFFIKNTPANRQRCSRSFNSFAFPLAQKLNQIFGRYPDL